MPSRGGFSVLSSPHKNYANWPIDRRVDAYLLHPGLVEFVNDGAASGALLERVMASIGHAIRAGLLAPPHIQGRD